MTDKQRRQQQEKLKKELETPYKKWLTEDVGYIISDEERKAFKVACRLTKSGSSSSNNSGCGAIPPRTPKKTNTAKSTTAASRMPTSILPRAFRAGSRIAA